MRLFRNIFVILLVMGMAVSSFAQQKKLVQFSGVIHNADTNVVVPYVTVINQSFNSQTFTANHQGYFSFVAHEGDTILFRSVGYRAAQVVIPKVPDDKYTAMVHMTAEIKELPVVTPYPWASIDEFNMAFMSLEIADDDIVVAKKNLSPESIAALAAVTPRSAEEIQNFSAMQNHIRLSNQAVNQRMANPLLSPFAWGNLIRQIAEGNKSRSRGNNQ
ncbi:hypothetical protein JHJ32_11800 [Parapedobacter sp. ISTM3]|uniref:CarboxypepD_reg-like domain-containing protein n=1 Tax=Parapedobacter luteus TaxID=623280 RepID=A0A1T5CWI7_9SPHI|nr:MULTISPECIES: hypothetical protein [Parapedobacter]MBK1440673.1 hypothetical protein [Parapedobacter sp. ISTM3]SKB63701.1 hypothetical protein SAMN05660226_02415 [Parapedobacter luteus]